MFFFLYLHYCWRTSGIWSGFYDFKVIETFLDITVTFGFTQFLVKVLRSIAIHTNSPQIAIYTHAIDLRRTDLTSIMGIYELTFIIYKFGFDSCDISGQMLSLFSEQNYWRRNVAEQRSNVQPLSQKIKEVPWSSFIWLHLRAICKNQWLLSNLAKSSFKRPFRRSSKLQHVAYLFPKILKKAKSQLSCFKLLFLGFEGGRPLLSSFSMLSVQWSNDPRSLLPSEEQDSIKA